MNDRMFWLGVLAGAPFWTLVFVGCAALWLVWERRRDDDRERRHAEKLARCLQHEERDR